MKPSVRTRLAISVAAIALVAAGCGSDDSSDETEPPAATAAVTTAAADTTMAEAATTAPAGGEYGDVGTTAAAPGTTGAAAADGVSVEVSETSLGEVLTSDGLTLYMFTPDEGGTPTCVDACAGAWPPLVGEAGAAGAGVDADQITVVDRPDGTKQLAYAGWPLYFYAEDQAAGDVTGQGVGDKWYVLGADGTPITS